MPIVMNVLTVWIDKYEPYEYFTSSLPGLVKVDCIIEEGFLAFEAFLDNKKVCKFKTLEPASFSLGVNVLKGKFCKLFDKDFRKQIVKMALSEDCDITLEGTLTYNDEVVELEVPKKKYSQKEVPKKEVPKKEQELPVKLSEAEDIYWPIKGTDNASVYCSVYISKEFNLAARLVSSKIALRAEKVSIKAAIALQQLGFDKKDPHMSIHIVCDNFSMQKRILGSVLAALSDLSDDEEITIPNMKRVRSICK